MNKYQILFVLAAGSCLWTAAAQDTNILRTQIGQFENRTGSVIIKGYGVIGSVPGGGGAEISVRCKETTDVSVGRKLYGLAIDINVGRDQRERIYVDDNEIDSLLAGLNYVRKISYDVTELPSFEASYTTKGGFEVRAHSIRKEGTLQFFAQGNYSPPIQLNSIDVSKLYDLILSAQKNLDSLKPAK